jgi:AcrR family transcriptional regulator
MHGTGDVSHCQLLWRVVGRWEPDSRGRLQEAALALYAEKGFDQTTAAEIANRAGLTERTFFRHFADKREVLFGGALILQERIVAGVREAPPSDGPLDAVARGLAAAAEMLGEYRRDLSRLRHAVISGTPELRERELAKLADYSSAVAAALRDRGVGPTQAALAAEAGMTILRFAMEQWAGGRDDRALTEIMGDTVSGLREVVGTGVDPVTSRFSGARSTN